MVMTPTPRIGYGDALRAVMNELAQGSPMSIAALSKKLNIDRRTIGKVIDTLLEVQDMLAAKRIETSKIGRRFVVSFINRTASTRRMLESAISVVRRKTKL